MNEPMTFPGDKESPKDWWLQNACRIAAFRLRQQRYMSANTVPIREQVRDSVEFVRPFASITNFLHIKAISPFNPLSFVAMFEYVPDAMCSG